MKISARKHHTDIMLAKQVLDRDFKFKNRELADRNISSIKMELLPVALSISCGAAWLLYTHAIMSVWPQLLFWVSVVALAHFVVVRFCIRSNYAEASELVLRNEPLRVRAQLIKGLLFDRVKIYPIGEDTSWASSLRPVVVEHRFCLWAIGLTGLLASIMFLLKGQYIAIPLLLLLLLPSLGLFVQQLRMLVCLEFRVNNRKLRQAHPELLQGSEVEIYRDKRGFPVGIFVDDRVDWFI